MLNLDKSTYASTPFRDYSLHPENTKLRLPILDSSSHSSIQSLRQHRPRMRRRDDPIVPQSSRRIHSVTLLFDPCLELRINRLTHRLHNRTQLLRAHNPNLRLWPHPEEPRGVSSSTHTIISCASASTYHDSELGDVSTGDCCDELRAVFGYAAFFGVGADHEATDVLEEDEGDAALGAELDEVCAFEGGFGEEDAVVGEDADGVAVDAGEAWWKRSGGTKEKAVGDVGKTVKLPVTRVSP